MAFAADRAVGVERPGSVARIAAPTDRLAGLAWGALAARAAAGALRWLSGGAVGFAGLLVLSLALASLERPAAPEAGEPSAAAYLDFDLAVLRSAAGRTLAGAEPALDNLWARRPDWQLPRAQLAAPGRVPLRDAWSAAVADKSRFRTAARGALGALPLLLGGLCLAFAFAAAGGVVAEQGRGGKLLRSAGTLVLVVLPLAPMLDPALFYDRARAFGSGPLELLFVAAFAGTASGAAARALSARRSPVPHLTSLRGRPALATAARLAALDAADWLLPLVPALVAAALFACARADQELAPGAGAASGLGALVRAALREPAAGARLSSCASVAGALVLLWHLGNSFVIEVRAALGAGR